MCFISNISLMIIAPTSEFCEFKSMWRSWRRLWHCSYLHCAICMVHVSDGVEPVVSLSVAPDHRPLEQLQWRHMGVMASQINWSVFGWTTNKYCEWNHQCRGFPSQKASNGENSCILTWGTIMMRTHYQQQCWRHDMDTLSASPFVNGIRRSPLVSDVQPSTVVELTAIWYYVMLIWCHYNDKWAVNFNVLMFFETIVYKNWESLNCPVSLWFEICAPESVGCFDVPSGTVLSS